MNENVWPLILLGGGLLAFLLAVSFLSKNYSLNNFKSKTVGDGQHGTARWATPKEIHTTYHVIPFRPRRWRKGEDLPMVQGIILGSMGGRKHRVKKGMISQATHKLLERLRRPTAGKKEQRKPKKKKTEISKIKNVVEDQQDVRALVDSVKDCYAVLGIVHTAYTPMPGRFKDYIAMPKPNMYQSLHNTLIGPHGQVFEVQIRTWEMHRTSEYGIAAHWKYKEGRANEKSSKAQKSEEAKLAWLRQIMEWQKDMSDNKEYLDTIKLDLNIYSTQVYAFTPQGDVIQLTKDSTPIDFAYMIHSAVGNKMVGARVNNKIVPLDHKIQNGDIVEIITSQNSKGPNRDWLAIVKTAQARTKIKQWFKKEEKEENIIRGREMILADIKKKGYQPQDLLRPEWEEIVLVKYDFKTWDALLAAVGYGGMKEGQVVNRLKDEYLKEKRKTQTAEDALKDFEKTIDQKPVKKHKSKSGVVVEGIDNCPIKFAKCCSPLPGDDIIGFVTRGFGVSIHKRDCANVQQSMKDPENAARWVNAYWADDAKEDYKATLELDCMDRANLLSDVALALGDMRVPIYSLTARAAEQGRARMSVTVGITNTEHLNSVVARLKKIKDVVSVTRN